MRNGSEGGAATAADLPPSAAWRHRDARDGFETVFFGSGNGTRRFEGTTAAVEEGEPWVVHYVIETDGGWRTRRAAVRGWSRTGERELTIEGDGSGHWVVGGAEAPHMDGCLDVDLESSACTNALPVRRLALRVGQRAQAPAVYVRAIDLAVERLEQSYARIDDDAAGHHCYAYASPAFDFSCRLVSDRWGLAVDYPGIASRIL